MHEGRLAFISVLITDPETFLYCDNIIIMSLIEYLTVPRLGGSLLED